VLTRFYSIIGVANWHCLERGFGSAPDALGIVVVKDLPPTYAAQRTRLLQFAYKFAQLDEPVREKYVDVRSHYRCALARAPQILWLRGCSVSDGRTAKQVGPMHAGVEQPNELSHLRKS
jgi:hypothetical protein